jgi:adenylate cyclase
MAELSQILYRRVVLIYALTAGLTVVAGGIVLLVGLDLTLRQIGIILGILAPLAIIPMFTCDLLVINRHLRPVRAFLESKPGASSARAHTQFLNLPWLSGLRVMLVHIPSFGISITLLIVLANSVAALGLRGWQIAVLWLGTILVGSGHALAEFFAVSAVVRAIIPRVWGPEAELSAEVQGRLVPVGLQFKLMFVSVFIVFIPLLLLGFTMLLKVNNLLTNIGYGPARSAALSGPLLGWVILLILITTLMSLFISIIMARDVTRSASELVRALRQVESGALDTHVAVTTTDEFSTLYDGFNRMTSGLQERERLRDAFGRYVAPELAEDVMRRGVQLGGQIVRATVLFADLRGFTTLSSVLSPEEVVGLLNGYFAAVEPVIQREGGWINKFGGDSLLAVFGTPVPHADHAQRALRAALGLQSAVAGFNQQQRAAGKPSVRVGVGVHTGELVAGNVGSPSRMEYTVIGDIVNVASRIDGLNKQFNTNILVSAEALAAAGDNFAGNARALPPTLVKGKAEPIQVYVLEN